MNARSPEGARFWRKAAQTGLTGILAATVLAGCGLGGGSDSGTVDYLATKVAQQDARIAELERRLSEAPDGPLTPNATATPTPQPPPSSSPIPLATLAARAARGEVTLIREWQGNRPRRTESFPATAPWVLYWTLSGGESQNPLRIEVFQLGQQEPLSTPVLTAVDGQGQEFLFESGSFFLQVSGGGTWQMRVANIA